MPTELLNRLEYLDHLIRIKGTGTPEQLAGKLKISRRSLYNHIRLLKEHGAPIMFCRKRGSYYYTEDGRFYFCFLKKNLSQKVEAGGGQTKKILIKRIAA